MYLCHESREINIDHSVSHMKEIETEAELEKLKHMVSVRG